MFKIESYIAPLLMGYVDKYVKLNQEDFQISLWGGDAVLNNLDLRLDAIENAIHLPITFKSGHIHELRLHVPWTKLGSEPVVITVNTIECILKLRDTPYSDTASSKSEGGKLKTSQSKAKLRRQEAEELPPGYLQSLMHKIVNNVNIIVNNLIIKFVEDDIVLSLNVKSAEIYSVDINWMRSFIELTQSELVLRRAINFCDLTVCLDKRDASGKIENYQDPLIYRCSVACRLHMTHDSIHNKLPTVTKLCVCCDKLDLSLTDTQLPMFIRLIELFLALYYGTFDFPSPTSTPSHEPSQQEVARQIETPGAETREEMMDDYDDEDQVGWGEWAWSLVPQLLPDDEEEEEDQDVRCRKPQAAVVSIGFYAQKCTIMFKLTEKLKEKIRYGPQKVAFRPFIFLETEGIALDIILHGLNYIDIQFGLTNLRVISEGNCICGLQDQEDLRSKVLLHGGSSLQSKSTLSYMSKSLFDPNCPENLGQPADFLFDGEKHLQVYTEQYATQKFGVFWMDCLYVMDKPEHRDKHDNSSRSSVSDMDLALFLHENSVMRFLVGTFHVIVSSSMVHRLEKFLQCAHNYEYEPYGEERPEHVDEDRPHPTEEQVKSLEEFIPVRSYHLTILQPVITVVAAEHPHCDMKKKFYKSIHKSEKGTKTNPSTAQTQTSTSSYMLPAVCVSADRFHLQVTTSMYPRKLVQLISKMAGPSSNLLHHCHSHTQIKLFGLYAGLVKIEPSGTMSTLKTVVSPCSAALYTRSLLMPMYWNNSHLPKLEHLYELPQLSVHLTKASLLLSISVLLSWQQATPKPSQYTEDSLMEDVFSQSGSTESTSNPTIPILEMSVSGFEVKNCQTPTVKAYTGTVSSMHIVVYTKDRRPGVVTPIMYAPVDTSKLHTPAFFSTPLQSKTYKNEYLTFTFQLPTHKELSEIPGVFLLNTEGIVCCVDPVLDDWLSYSPRRKFPLSRARSKENKVAVDLTLAHVASPLQANISQVSLQSSQSVTQTSPSQGLSKTQTPSQQQSQRDQQDTEETTAKEVSWGLKMADIFPVLRILHVQLEVKNVIIFVPRSHLVISEPCMNIAENVHSLLKSGNLPNTLVVSLPCIHLQGSGLKPISILQEIPIRSMEGSLIGDKLPWLLSLNNCSAYTLGVNSRALPLVKTLTINCTVAVTSKYTPPTSDNISFLGLCLHTDLNAVTFCCSKKQVKICAGITSQLIAFSHNVQGLLMLISSQYSDTKSSGTKQQPAASGSIQTQQQASMGPADLNNTTTDTSCDFSHDTSPSRELEIDEEMTEGVKLSLWMQWTLPKLEMKFYRHDLLKARENKVSLIFEDITTSVDIQEVYIKVKANVGSLNIHSHVRNSSSQSRWDESSLKAIVMTSHGEISRDTQIIASKLWFSDGQRSPAVSQFTATEPHQNVNHGFLNITVTRALCKNVKRKLRKMNVELAGMQDAEMMNSNFELYFHKFISEVCLNIDPCDFVFNLPAVVTVLDCFDMNENSKKTSAKFSGTHQMLHSEKEQASIPVLSASSLPLLYINISTIRLFLPLSYSLARDRKSPTSTSPRVIKTTVDHDVVMLQLHSLLLGPQAENPLPRYAVDKEFYLQALQAGISQYPGSAVEDRQYQIDVKGLTLCTGCWDDFVECFTPPNERNGSSSATQIPALEWNTLLQPFEKEHEEEIRLSPLATAFDMRILAAPAIVYQHKEAKNSKMHIVCGHSLEVNVTSELDFYVSTNQVKLLQDIYTDSMRCLSSHSKGSTELINRHFDFHGASSDRPSVDSGVGSDTSVNTTERRRHASSPPQQIPSCSASSAASVDQSQISEKTAPFDILLTAGRIACTVYSHRVLKNDYRLPPESSKLGATERFSKSDLETKDRPVFALDADCYVAEDGVSEPFVAYSGCGISADGCSDFAFMNIHKRGSLEEDNVIPGGSTCIVPFLYVYISQPHTVISCRSTSQKFVMSCYDVLLKGPPDKYVIPVSACRIMPDCSDFTMYTVETKAGTPDPKTGIPPSLYTLTVTDFMQEQACVNLRLERPLKVHLSLSKLTQVTDLLHELLPGNDSHVSHIHERDLPPLKEEVNSMQSYLSKIDRLELVTEQVVVSLETILDDKSPRIIGSIGGTRIDMEFQQNDDGIVETVVGSMYLSDFLVKTGYEKTKRLLFGPCAINLELVCQWYGQSWTLPKSMVTMTTGLVILNFGQDHLLCFDLMRKHFEEFFENESSVSKTESEVKPEKESSELDFIVEQTTDDLRSGGFQYLTDHDGNGMQASPGEITFCLNKEMSDSFMTWCYYQPRVLSLVKLTPIPFNLCEEGSQLTEVPCVLQYFDPVRRDFIDYVQFYISENQENILPIPEVKKENQQELIVAQMWKVIIKPLNTQQDSTQSLAESGHIEEEPLILPASLAASIRIDSCFVPSIIPFVQGYMHAKAIQLHLSNHLQHCGSGVPSKLKPFHSDKTVPSDQEFAVVLLQQPALIACHWQGSATRTAVQFSNATSMEVLEYRNLTMQTILLPTEIYGDLSFSSGNPPELEVNCTTEPVFLKISQGPVHTLSCTAQVWDQLALHEEPQVIFSHYVLCNNTHQVVRFGQVGTDENLVLGPREFHCYSWRSHKLSQQELHFCLDRPSWKWCESMDINTLGTFVRNVPAKDQHYTLIIQVKELSNLQKQIIINGQLVISSRLTQHIEIKVQTQGQKQEFILGAQQTSPTYILEPDDISFLQFRIMGHKSTWTKDVHVCGNKLRENRLLKIPLADNNYMHVWCQVFCQHLQTATQTAVLLAPLFVLRSHLACPLFIDMETPKLKQKRNFELLGKGKAFHLECTGGDIIHNLSFKLRPSLQKSSTVLNLSSGLIEQVERQPLKKVDTDMLINSCIDESESEWPYTNTEQRQSDTLGMSAMFPRSENSYEVDSDSQMKQPSMELNVQLLENMPGCSTLLVDITSWCLMTNASGIDLVVIDSDGKCWELPRERTFTPPIFEKDFILGVRAGDNVIYQSDPIPLSEEEVEYQRYRSDIGNILFIDGFVHLSILQLDSSQSQGYFLCVNSSPRHGMRIIEIRDRFCVSNLTSSVFQAKLLCVPLGKNKAKPPSSPCMEIPSHVKSDSNEVLPLITWVIIDQDRISLSAEHVGFVYYIMLKFNHEGYNHDANWSYPVRLIANGNGARFTLSVPMADEKLVRTKALCITGHQKSGVTYFVILEDTAPFCAIHNFCSVPLHYGQTLMNLSLSGTTVQEETELIQCLPTVPPGGIFYYTPPFVNTKFPEVTGGQILPRLHVALATEGPDKSSLDSEKLDKSMTNSHPVWSSGIDLTSQTEMFFSIPNVVDLKVQVKHVCMVTHVIVEPIGKAEVSAKEIRSRIRGKNVVSVVDHDNCQSEKLQRQISKVKPFDDSWRTTTKHSLQMSIGLYLKEICLTVKDDVCGGEDIPEVLRISVDSIFFSHYPAGLSTKWDKVNRTCVAVSVEDIQIDNQLFGRGEYDFPVVFIKQNTTSKPSGSAYFSGLNVAEKQAVTKASSFAFVQFVFAMDSAEHSVIESVEISMKPLCMFLDDSYILKILKEVETFIPVKLSNGTLVSTSEKKLPKEMKCSSVLLSSPVRIQQVSIHSISMLLSVHASLKLFIASDRTPLTFTKLEKKTLYTTSHQLIRILAMHFASGALFRAGMVVGSLEILGNPTGLLRSIGTGVADLIKLPYNGITRGPGSFVAGVSKGMGSLLRNVSGGMITSVTNFASSVSKNMDRLSMDTTHRERQEQTRRHRPDGISDGLKQGLTGFGLSLLGAVAGLADQPIQNVLSSDARTERTLSSSDTAGKFVTGVGKGIVGVFAKPIGGAAELVSQTGQGLLAGTGLSKPPEPKYSAEVHSVSQDRNGAMKCVVKLLQSVSISDLMMIFEAEFVDVTGSLVPVTLLLTPEILCVLNCEEDAQQQAFSILELECSADSSNQRLLTVFWHDTIHQEIAEAENHNKERVAAFIDGTAGYVQLPSVEGSPISNSSTTKTESSSSPTCHAITVPKYHFYTKTEERETFLILFQIACNKLSGRGFTI